MSRVSLDDVVRAVADAQDMSLATTKAVLDTAFGYIKSSVAAGDQVSVTKFGAFVPMRSKAYTARNPKTGESVALPGKHVPHFKPGKELRERVSGVTPLDEQP